MREAACSCGQLRIRCEGEPVRISLCHCLNCQKRTGSPFAVQARWPKDRVAIEGSSSEYVRVGDEGGRARFHFCATCGVTMYYLIEALPDVVAVPVGVLGEPAFPPPTISVYSNRKHAWVATTGIELEELI